MKRQLVSLMIGLLLFALSLSACGGAASPNPDSQGEVTDYASLVAALQAAGTTVEEAGEVEQAFFGPTGQIIQVNGQDVQVFEYPDAESAEAEAAMVAPDGGSIGTTMVSWIATPHFFKAEKIIVLYVGDDAEVIELLIGALGEQFAGR